MVSGAFGKYDECNMAKVEFEEPVKSLRGLLVGSDPYYFRRYPKGGGGYMHIAQGRPNRKGHKATSSERANRELFATVFGKQKHAEYIKRKYFRQLKIDFGDDK